MSTFYKGEKVIWCRELRGGYGFIHNIPAEVIGVSKMRVRIRANLAKGGTRDVSVNPKNLKRQWQI